MAGINIDVKTGGELRDCSFDDTDVGGGSGSAVTVSGQMSGTKIQASSADATINNGTEDCVVDCVLNLNDVTVTSGTIAGTKLVCDHLALNGNDSAFTGGRLELSPGSGVNEGVLVAGDLVGLTDTLVVAVNPYATDTAQGISVTGDYALLDGLRFKRSGTKSWEYLIELQSGATDCAVGVYSTTTTAYATGEVSDSGTGTKVYA